MIINITRSVTLIFFLSLIIGEASASEATKGVSKAVFMTTVGMTKQEVKAKFGPPDNTMKDRMTDMWVYFNLYDPDTEKSDPSNNCSLFFKNDIVDHVNC